MGWVPHQKHLIFGDGNFTNDGWEKPKTMQVHKAIWPERYHPSGVAAKIWPRRCGCSSMTAVVCDNWYVNSGSATATLPQWHGHGGMAALLWTRSKAA